MNTSDILNRAADLIEERGWQTGDGWVFQETPEGSGLCLEGAIQAAAGIVLDYRPMDDLWGCPAYLAVADHLDDARFSHLYKWNDRTGRTASEVIEVLRACAVIEASRERQTAEVSA